jgi:uncharacterized protein YbcV (DUF1398 family)
MVTLTHIDTAAQSSTSYVELVKKYMEIGIESYTVDVATDIVCYRLKDGHLLLRHPGHEAKAIAPHFHKDKVVAAIEANIAGKSNYPTFMHDIAKAGVHFYEATLVGDNKRVTYVGILGSHEELIPLS